MRSAQLKHPQTPVSILLVDDNRDGVLARRSVLEEIGYRVVSATCGREALLRVDEQAFDLVITDYRMSPMDGLELIKELRERKFSNPIILLSGFADSIGLRAEDTGADVVIQKSANEITTLVRQTSRLVNPKKPAGSQRTARPPLRARSAGRG